MSLISCCGTSATRSTSAAGPISPTNSAPGSARLSCSTFTTVYNLRPAPTVLRASTLRTPASFHLRRFVSHRTLHGPTAQEPVTLSGCVVILTLTACAPTGRALSARASRRPTRRRELRRSRAPWLHWRMANLYLMHQTYEGARSNSADFLTLGVDGRCHRSRWP